MDQSQNISNSMPMTPAVSRGGAGVPVGLAPMDHLSVSNLGAGVPAGLAPIGA